MVAFCASCSHNIPQHKRLHDINHISQIKHQQKHHKLLVYKDNLKKENHKLKHQIKNIHFD